MRIAATLAAILLCACGTSASSRFDDVLRAQQQLDQRGIGFGVARVPGHDAFVLQLRFAVSDTGQELSSDPMAAAQAAAPEGCVVVGVAPLDDGASYRADYQCQ